MTCPHVNDLKLVIYLEYMKFLRTLLPNYRKININKYILDSYCRNEDVCKYRNYYTINYIVNITVINTDNNSYCIIMSNLTNDRDTKTQKLRY